VKITPELLRRDGRNMRVWKKKEGAAGITVDTAVRNFNSGAPTKAEDPHKTVDLGFQEAKSTWAEAFRLGGREMDLLGKILYKAADDADLTDAELTYLVTHQ
jgi:hypothetical protein